MATWFPTALELCRRTARSLLLTPIPAILGTTMDWFTSIGPVPMVLQDLMVLAIQVRLQAIQMVRMVRTDPMVQTDPTARMVPMGLTVAAAVVAAGRLLPPAV